MMNDCKEECFWMVWNPRGHSSTHKHWTKQLAVDEANRLARTNPGQRFIVLKAVGGACTEQPALQKIKIVPRSDDIPF